MKQYISVKFITSLRGFFSHLLNEKDIKASLMYNSKSLYEVNTKFNYVLKQIGRSFLLDWLRFINIPKAKGGNCDVYGSFNRFLKSDKPYFIYLENPTALYHYRLIRKENIVGEGVNRRIIQAINNSYLRFIICMSSACKDSFETVCTSVPNNCKLIQIYPLIPDNGFVSEQVIIEKCQKNNYIRLLFIAQGIRFLSKGALEVFESFKRLREEGYMEVTLTMVTSFSDVDSEVLNMIRSYEGITLCDFKLSNKEMQELYSNHSILLIPTSDDSFNITVLEAIKSGLPVIGSTLYAIPEMVKEGFNGFLTEPSWQFFDRNNVPNPQVWNNRDKTIYSKQRNERVTRFLYNCILRFIQNRDLLLEFSLNSYKLSTSPPFSREYIVSQWNKVFGEFEK